MQSLLRNFKVVIHESLYLKDPETSDLGKNIVGESILLIDEIGFEKFTFKKLGSRIGSNESSIYRYFENKHKLLLYLTSWYWAWMEYKLVFRTANLNDTQEVLRTAIEVLSEETKQDSDFSHVNEKILNAIIISEFSKSYLTKEVDKENKEGCFSIYKRLVGRFENIIQNAQPNYPYVESLASMVIEGVLHQHYLKQHFPSLTSCDETTMPHEFFTHLVFSTLNLSTHE
ncbi:TetR/AcrR family transcriptional regulator [Altibacter sp. HG106]|uniref:TetR/AcrR family transcriptional regulator n=1 Tax=Altibacter sp. HG106 TaxID=3023937 RepID=UPI0023506399|nr:TetR/AcrR family transcriptional regulator [Altibacter sp. HG106]MDC7994058.1 TetR/AcrR family transcriptional regulator [Altibacter sp. HG106]